MIDHQHIFLLCKKDSCPLTRRSGVLRTHLLLMVRGAKESHGMIRLCCNLLKPERLFTAFPHVKVSFPSDGKFTNMLLGLMEPSAAYGYPYSFWSPFKRFSKPEQRRTVAQLVVAAGVHANAAKRSVSFIQKKCFSVVSMPIEFAIQSPRDMADTFPPGFLDTELFFLPLVS